MLILYLTYEKYGYCYQLIEDVFPLFKSYILQYFNEVAFKFFSNEILESYWLGSNRFQIDIK